MVKRFAQHSRIYFVGVSLSSLLITNFAYGVTFPLSFSSQPSFPITVTGSAIVTYVLKNNTKHDNLPLYFSMSSDKGELEIYDVGNTCGNSIAAGSSCTLPVLFTPAIGAVGNATGSLTISYRGRYPLIANPMSFSLSLTPDVGMQCWGFNSNGQLGDGTTTSSNTPVNVDGLAEGVTAATGGTIHTCALSSTGGVQCWGGNTNGQLGNGSNVDSTFPVDVTGLTSGVTAIVAGWYHTCALISGGVKCWGLNADGQLGDNSTTASNVPVDVSGLSSGVIAITGGAKHTCALLSGGTVKCWGRNAEGQLGDGTNTPSLTPVSVSGLSGVSTITAGSYHTCALVSGAAKCWGYNFYGQLGNNSTTSSNIPVSVSGLSSGVTAITGGNFHTCALLSGGNVKCWGYNSSGQLGNGSNTDSSIPVDVTGLSSGVTAITGGYFHNCALLNTNAIRCWGYNSNGELGNGTNTPSNIPVSVISLSGTPFAILNHNLGDASCDIAN